ncbi:MAG: DUF3267 domain-containing protein [Clostridia bacterium]|nr:DUF3267 domain-containing protein [Clostridia bacterium]
MNEQKLPSATLELPKNYKLGHTVDMQTNKKQSFLVNLIAILIGVALAVPMAFLVPLGSLFDMGDLDKKAIFLYILRFAVLLVGSFLYIILHELTHALFMKIFGAKKIKFGFTGLFAYAGSEHEYFKKWPYIIIALAPLVVFGIIFAVICPFIYTSSWFWIVYFWQIQNISGAAGDIYVSIKFLKAPKDAYIKDEGTMMKLFVPKSN